MLKKEYRLTPVSIRNPKSFKTPFFNLKIGRNEESVNRFAFIVSKKVDPRATERNQVKRKVRSCIEEIFDSIILGNDFIFYPTQISKSAKRGEILDEINKLFKENDLLK